MKSKTLLLACALCATVLSFSAFSTENSSVCTDPLQKICTDTKLQRSQRDVYIKAVKKEIAADAATRAGPRIHQMKKEIPIYHIVKRFFRATKIRNQEIMTSAKKRIGDIETVVTNPENVSLLKQYMSQAIDESHFDAVTKANFKSTIQSVIIGNFGDFLERTGLEDNVLGQMFSNVCGSDGMVSNAFATILNKDRYVLICPGLLITLSQNPNAKERFESILLTISHEMGHHIDNGQVGNELYRPYLGCLAENYADKFNATKDDKKFCEKNVKDPVACKMKITASHAGELIADAWGIKVLNVYARKQHYSFADTDQLLTSSWASFCGSGDEGIHPTGDFRIGTLLRTNPDIASYLACDNSAVNSKPACTLEGVVNI